ncbi:LysR family transcriptional regulator [Salinibacterium sp. SYSU T00001]|uniref:LysR family transcriptional regulator n=1 Tax=Homoserinimonas sedimenticola TaxID=2986805 RepID=UPI002235CABC|nr:LysR family transcriptional regulator [Salinibacterium sedimenticola]MCW4385668.1 LysR family transcriptional regulator [Salinibacterium sedimenticola]
MKTLAAVARSSTFSGAASELGISPSLVSRHVADLESQVGVRLVNRTPRSVTLTPAGFEYAAFVERILQEIEDTDAQLAGRQHTAEGQLSVICPKWIGSLDLGAAIAAFVKEHPRIRVRMELGGISDRLYDFLDRGFDVAFHARDPRDSRVRVRRVSELPFMLAASPEYLAERGTPLTPADLQQHTLISHVSDPVWRLGMGEEQVTVKVHDPIVATNAYLVMEQLVESGSGIALIPRRPALPALASGAIVEVLPQLPPPPRSLYAVHGPGGQTPERVKVFLDFMTDWFRRGETG